MSRIKDLRTSEESTINLVDIIELFTPTFHFSREVNANNAKEGKAEEY